MEQHEDFSAYDKQDKPTLLKAVDLILANPADIRKQVLSQKNQYELKYGRRKTKEQMQDDIANHIIKNYSNFTAFAGGATALTSIIPGLGQVLAVVGGASADAALCMKWQIEMVMAIATVYGRDITVEEEKNLCFIIAGVGTISEASKAGAKAMGAKAFKSMLKQYLKGSSLQAIKEIFKQVGFTFTRKAAEKVLPFGIGVIIGASANKLLTKYVGSKAKEFFCPHAADDDFEDILEAEVI